MDATSATATQPAGLVQFLDRLSAEARAVGAAVEERFTRLAPAQLDWRPDQQRWSIGQCLEHLVIANGAFFPLFAAIEAGNRRRLLRERVPLLPRLWGRFMRRVVAPGSRTRVTAPRAIRPSLWATAPDIARRFLDHQAILLRHFAALRDYDLRQVVTSPLAGFVTYALGDACEIIVLHQHRHLAQADEVRAQAGFPAR